MSDKEKQRPFERYLEIMEVIAAAHDGLRLIDIASVTGLPKPTIHRLVQALVEAEVVEADGERGRSFTVAPRLWRLLYLAMNRETVASYALIVCEQAAAQLNETCYIARLGTNEIRIIARSVPEKGYRLHVTPGEIPPPHAAAAAKAILAFQNESVLPRYYPKSLARLTEFTKTDLAVCLAELETVRSQKFAICDKEIDEFVMAYAVPIELPNAGVLFSIGVTGPVTRLLQDTVDHYIETLNVSGNKFSEMLQTTEDLLPR